MSSGNIFERLFKQTATILKLVVDNKRDAGEVSRIFQSIIDEKPVDISSVLAGWQAFYRKFFWLDLDLSSVKIPERQSRFDRLIVVAKGLTLNQVYAICAKHFPCWRYADDLDKEVIQNDRQPTQTYAVWVRDRVEADEENKNLSANQLKKQKALGITLLERLVYELKYFQETGKHLDVENVTLCSGSRDSDGSVPRAYWYDDKFKVHWCNPGGSRGDIRSRSVVF
jgi:hypothetical protein